MPDLLTRVQAALADRYRVERELGSGGMATVYLAIDSRHDRRVALKVLRPELTAILGRERFLNEIRLTAQLDHPNILTLIDSGEAEGLLYLVLPFARGESLGARLTRERQLRVDEAVQIATQVAGALEYAHQLGIVHRDIKPDNILLHEGAAMVADFGIALALREAGGTRLTETGLSLGTPQYMSPEQATGDRNIDARTDVYSLGAVIYEMLTGEPPFSGPSVQAVIAKLITQRPVPIRALRDSVSPALESTIHKALAKIPADRFATAGQFAAELSSPKRPEQVSAPRSRKVALIALVVSLAAGVAWHWRDSWQQLMRRDKQIVMSANAARSLHRIAVLYFQARGTDPELSDVADGLTEGLIDTLRGVRSLHIISKGGVTPYRNSSLKSQDVAKALGVEAMVQGTLEGTAERFRVTLRLISKSGAALAEDRTIQGSSREMLQIQDSLANTVLELLGRGARASPSAWLLVQRARRSRADGDSLLKVGDTAGLNRHYLIADSLAAVAAVLDPKWAEPIILRGNLAYSRSRSAPDDTALARKQTDTALVYAQRALVLDGKNLDALELRGRLNYWRWLMKLESDSVKAHKLLISAIGDVETVVNARPSQAESWAMLSHMYYQIGTVVKVKIAAIRAYQMDPYISNADRLLSRLFYASYDLEQFADAAHWCKEFRSRFPENPGSVECQLYLLTTRPNKPDVKRAWQLADSLVRLTPAAEKDYQRLIAHMIVAATAARAGLADSARHVAERSRGGPDVDPAGDLLYTEAFVRTLLGDRDEAIRTLKAYLSTPDKRASFAADTSWWFRTLQDDPRYRELGSRR